DDHHAGRRRQAADEHQHRQALAARGQGQGQHEAVRVAPPEIAQELNLPRSTVFRLLHTLQMMGFVQKEGDERHFKLGPAVLSHGFEYLASLDIVEAAQPILQRLRDEMETTLKESRQLRTCRYFYAEGPESLESLMATKPATFETVDTAWDDVCLIAFTSGTTGPAKGCM
ncbi:helix-turn-helix domain-containing protein, partial [Halomonas neptunia]